MLKLLPDSFTSFLVAIIEAESLTDQWKAKIFCKSFQII